VKCALSTLLLVIVWAALIFFGTSEGWWKQPLAPRGDAARFMEAARELVDAGNRGNAVFALLDGGSVYDVHAVSVGTPVDANTVFQTASLSKWITAWGVMVLVEQGKLDLDAPVGTYLRRWRLPESEFDNDHVTARRLLSHTAGLTDGLGYAGFKPGARVQSLEESLTAPADVSPGASGVIRVGYEPGTRWEYSGGGYALLQLLIEELSGEPFEAFMERSIFRQLGMEHSSYRWAPGDGRTLAASYDVDSRPATYYRFAAVAPTSLYTSVSDLARFIEAHLPGKAGEPIGRGVLAPATIHEMQRPHASKFGQDIWGLGTMLYAGNGTGGFIVGHDGNNEPAINTAARFNPATGNGIVILETGEPLLATRLAGEWVFWETGNVDFLAFTIAMPRMLRQIGFGSLAIILAMLVLSLALRYGRRSRLIDGHAA
jgi:CubicO group peptidase (beta-lactamase class C family)